MERTLVALGLVLAVAGLVLAVNGYVYVNVDRGPPMMISGVLAFGFGLLIAALGLVLRELQAISADASKAALLLAKSRNGAAAAPAAPEEPPASPKPLPPLAPFEPPAPPPAPAPLADQAVETQSDLFAPRADDKPRRPVLSPAPEPKPLAPSLPPLSWMAKPKKAEQPAEKSGDDDWLNQAIAAEADKAAREEKPAKEAARPEAPRLDKAIEDKWSAPASQAHEADQALRREFGLSEAEDAPPATPPQSKPEVIGNYEAHGAHYTMYADGSIEAETQHGVYRFGSIEELKRFIEGEEAPEGAKA